MWLLLPTTPSPVPHAVLGIDAAERSMRLPGDEIIKDVTTQYMRAITIDGAA